MSKFIMKTAKCYVGGFNLSGDLNKMDLDVSVDVKESTNFLSTGKEKVPGYVDYKLSYSGYVNTGLNEKNLFENVALENVPFILVPSAGDAGSVGYFGKATYVEYRPGGQVGEMFGFELNAEGQGNIVRGTVLQNGELSASGSSSALNLGAVANNKQAFAILQILGVSGTSPSATFKISSAVSSSDTFKERVKFPTVNAIGALWAAPIDGPITDQLWRVEYELSAGSKFTAVLIVGTK